MAATRFAQQIFTPTDYFANENPDRSFHHLLPRFREGKISMEVFRKKGKRLDIAASAAVEPSTEKRTRKPSQKAPRQAVSASPSPDEVKARKRKRSA